eukprot:6389732-Alexandrium_andersonii.AAC.1
MRWLATHAVVAEACHDSCTSKHALALWPKHAMRCAQTAMRSVFHEHAQGVQCQRRGGKCQCWCVAGYTPEEPGRRQANDVDRKHP